MRIDQISIKNVIGARRVEADLRTPVTLFCGGNGAGKSSIAEAVRMAMLGDVERVKLKKEYQQLLTDGAKAGRVHVVNADGDACVMSLPDGKGSTLDDPTLPYVLEPRRFAAATPDERRTFLLDLAGIKMDGATVLHRLKERGCDETLSKKVLPMLRSGFPAAASFAANEARDAKGAWRGVTGETYGVVKAEAWEAAAPIIDEARVAALRTSVADLDKQIAAAQRDIGALEERRRQHEDGAEARKLIEKLPVLRVQLEHDEKALQKYLKHVADMEAQAAPRTGLVHDLAQVLDEIVESKTIALETEHVTRASAALDAYKAEFGPIGAVPEKIKDHDLWLMQARSSRDITQRAIENARRNIAAAEAAQASQSKDGAFDAAAYKHAQGRLAEHQRARASAQADLDQLTVSAQAASEADAKTRQAAQHHADVQAWAAIADALAPDGIPGELLATVLTPVNDRLSASAAATGWMQVTIGADMAITAAGRPYGLLSESEQWRTDAMLAEAIAYLSGLKLLLLDRMDVLELAARGDLLGWLDDLVMSGDLDTALVFATLKSVPSGLPDTITAVWIEHGEIFNSQLQRAA